MNADWEGGVASGKGRNSALIGPLRINGPMRANRNGPMRANGKKGALPLIGPLIRNGPIRANGKKGVPPGYIKKEKWSFFIHIEKMTSLQNSTDTLCSDSDDHEAPCSTISDGDAGSVVAATPEQTPSR